MKYIKTYEGINEPEVKENFYKNGQKKYEKWYLNGKLHREDGPSIQYWYSNGQKRFEDWYLNGESHREDGPAYQSWYPNGQKEYEVWYLNGKEYSRENWINQLKKIGSPHYEEQVALYNAEKYNI